ncbi:MAG: ATP-dependent DNA helicase PcrA [Nitrospira bacterium HGW-Nitrospira-1]|nr:MAG: ATP-dependent DNA helicase PcrA [Nitrospira bacterium HGW-Nitrospira-1]
MSKESLMQDLNPQQREVLEYMDGPLLVLAGAGSGKTRVIAHKFAHLVKSKKLSPESILTVTFTNKAAGEMSDRVRTLVGKDLKSFWIGTLHSQCSRILRKEIKAIGYGNNFSIYDEDDRCNLIRHILKEFKIYEALYKGVSSRINFLKASLVGADDFLSSGDGYGFDERLAKVYVRYQDELKRSNALDFDDLIMLTVKLFEEKPNLLKKYQDQLPYLLVDEFQDLNCAQYNLIKLLAMQHRNICAVGDDDQSIYKFRGADVEHILNFEKDFPGTKVVRLERNYRSTQNILEVANAVIALNDKREKKKLWTERKNGEMVRFCWLNTQEEEAKHIAKIIRELYLKGSYTYKDIGILYRVNLQSKAIADALREAGLPYCIAGGISFYQRKDIKDLIAYVRLVINHGDNVSLRRVINIPARRIGTATLLKIENEAKKKSLCLFDAIRFCIKSNSIVPSTKDKLSRFVRMVEKLSSRNYKSASDILKNVADKSGYMAMLNEERRQNIVELISASEGKNIQEFIDKASLLTNSDHIPEGNYISLMPLHNAKGVEFPVVFVTGMEEGLLPYFKANGSNDEISEERRLFYVGITRAKDFLVLTGARKRRLYVKLQEQEPSRFLQDIPKARCKRTEKVTAATVLRCVLNAKKKPEPTKVRPYFDSGCRVKHPVWGVGVVRDCYGNGEDQKVMVNFPAIGLKRLSLKLANLTKL